MMSPKSYVNEGLDLLRPAVSGFVYTTPNGSASGGGKVFYHSDVGFLVNGLACHDLEAAPEDISGTLRWSTAINAPFIDISGTAAGIGAGYANTEAILALDPTAPAALACKNYRNNGKADWYLPSKEELRLMYQKKDGIGGFDHALKYYWSSSQHFTLYAWLQRFSDGGQYFSSKYFTGCVRAVRAF